MGWVLINFDQFLEIVCRATVKAMFVLYTKYIRQIPKGAKTKRITITIMIYVDGLRISPMTSGNEITYNTLDITVGKNSYILQDMVEGKFNEDALEANIEMLESGLELDQNVEVLIINRTGSIIRTALRLTIMPTANDKLDICFEANYLYIQIVEKATRQESTNENGSNIRGTFERGIIGEILRAAKNP